MSAPFLQRHRLAGVVPGRIGAPRARAVARRRSAWRRAGGGVLLWLLTLSSGGPLARAETAEERQECAAAYEQAQVSRAEGDLIRSAEQLVFCAGVGCPDAMQRDCSRWLDEVRVATPTVVFRALDPLGADLVGASVSVDGKPPAPLNGRAIAVNPGEHSLVVSAPGSSSRTLRFQFVEGHQLRREVVTLSPAGSVTAGTPALSASQGENPADIKPRGPAPGEAAARHITAVQWIAGGVALVGGIGFAYFGSKARGGENDLDDCSPDCTKAAVSDVKRDYLYANLSLGLGLLGLGAGAVHYFAQTPAASGGRGAISLRPAARGEHMLHLQGSF